MTLVRWMFGLPLAAAVVMFLVLIMSGLIRQEFVPIEAKDPLKLSIIPQIEPTVTTPTKIPRPDIKDPPPQPDVRTKNPGDPVDGIPTQLPRDIGFGDIPFDKPAGAGTVIVVAPPYPEACASKGVEGVVLVQFDVTAEGNVVNARIISSPHQCFNRTVIKAVSSWKYPPDTSGGRSAARYGVVERFNFQLTD